VSKLFFFVLKCTSQRAHPPLETRVQETCQYKIIHKSLQVPEHEH